MRVVLFLRTRNKALELADCTTDYLSVSSGHGGGYGFAVGLIELEAEEEFLKRRVQPSLAFKVLLEERGKRFPTMICVKMLKVVSRPDRQTRPSCFQRDGGCCGLLEVKTLFQNCVVMLTQNSNENTE